MNEFASAGTSTATALMLMLAKGEAADASTLVEIAFAAAYIEHGQEMSVDECREAFLAAFNAEMASQRFNMAAVHHRVEPDAQGSA